MRNGEKEQEFIDLFDTHVDTLFSHCFSRIPDRAQAQELIEKTFKRGWDEIVEGKQPQLKEFYRFLDELVNAKLGARDLPFPAFLAYFTGRMTRSS